MILRLLQATLLASSMAMAQSPSLLPLPAQVRFQDGSFALNAQSSIGHPAELSNEAAWLASRLRQVTALPLPTRPGNGSILFKLDPALGPEAYRLEITPSSATLTGGDPAGAFYAAVTFLQCLPAEAFGTEAKPSLRWSAPCALIEDSPQTSWRGVHLDSARHFQPKEWIFRFLDAMAAHKLNRFHWHLVDSEAWRLEIRRYPKLTEVHRRFPAYYPEEIPTNPTFRAKYRYGSFHGGGHYSQDDVREIVAHARKLHITIIPEIEFPGHAMAAITAYPEIGTTGKIPEIRSNISPDLIGVHPTALRFLRDVLDETMELFPGPWIHFGGDEAPKGQWQQDPYTQKKIDELGLRLQDPKNAHASEDALQAWLFNELAAHIAKKGRRAVGWEEIMHGPNLAKLRPDAVIMPWLSTRNAVVSANQGLQVVHTSFGSFYLDTYQTADPREPSTLYQGPLTYQAIHQFNLYPDGLTDQGKTRIAGAQAQLWAELMPRTDDVEYQAFPRVCALAELTWTAPALRQGKVEDFTVRLSQHGKRLTALGLNHRRVAPPAGPQWSPEFLSSASSWEFPLALEIPAVARELTFDFRYESGAHGLDIETVELLADRQVVGSDPHAGFTGGQPRQNLYRIPLREDLLNRQLTIRVRAKGSGGNDSTGRIEIKAR